MDWDSPEAQRLATAAIMQFQGQNYGDYLFTTAEYEVDPLTEEEWTKAEQYQEYVHEAVARLIAARESK